MFSLREKVMGGASLFLVLVLVGVWMTLSAQIKILEYDLERANKKIGELTTEVSTVRTANKQCFADLKTQADEIDKLKKENAKASVAAAEAMAKVQADAKKWRMKYNDLFTVTPEADECKAMAMLLERYRTIRVEEVSEVKK